MRPHRSAGSCTTCTLSTFLPSMRASNCREQARLRIQSRAMRLPRPHICSWSAPGPDEACFLTNQKSICDLEFHMTEAVSWPKLPEAGTSVFTYCSTGNSASAKMRVFPTRVSKRDVRGQTQRQDRVEMVRSVARVCTHLHFRLSRGAKRPAPCGKPVYRTTDWRTE